jgi:hypothetical protein
MANHPLQHKNAQVTQKKNGAGKRGISLADNRPQILQRKANITGLPDNLRSGIETLSDHSMDDVKVHYNSSQPAQLNAHAYAQGTNIHLAPGQEKHLPHEAWHVVQQKQGRVRPTVQMKGKVNINDDAGLEKEADVMGAKALQMKTSDAGKAVSNAGISKGVVQRGKKKGWSDPGTVRAAVDLVGSLTGVIKPDPGKPRTATETSGKAIKTVGSAIKLGAKTLTSDDKSEGMLAAIGTNLKATGEDISEAGKIRKDRRSTKAKKGVAITRATASVISTVSETTRETLRTFGIVDEAVPLSVITLLGDAAKTLSFGHDFYEILYKIYASYQEGKMVEQLWANATSFFQKVGSFSMAALRAVAIWERLKGQSEEYYLKLMPLGKSLLNLSTAFAQAKTVYSDYNHYQVLMRMSSTGAKKAVGDQSDNLKSLAFGKWDQMTKGMIDVLVAVGETIYWAGKHFVAIKGVSALVGAGSKILKTASTLFTSLNIRQAARDYLPSFGGLLVDKSKTSDKLDTKRAAMIKFLRGNKAKTNKNILLATGLDVSKINDNTYMDGLVKKFI